MSNRALFSFGVIAITTIAGLVLRAQSAPIRDVDGRAVDLFRPAGKANVLLFVSSDCPVSNGYAPEIQRICASSSRDKGTACTLVYEDVSIDAAAVRTHREQFRYGAIPAVVDKNRTIAQRAGATVTPTAVVVGAGGAIKYRGRIDNQFIALGKPRQVVTIHDLRDAIDAVFAGRPIAQPQTQAFGCFIPTGGSQP